MKRFLGLISERLVAGVALIATVSVGCNKVPTATVTGTVTINGRGVPGVEVAFVPKEKIRPGVGVTDEAGKFTAQFLANQSGVPLGDCVVQISLFRDDVRAINLIPPEYNAKAADNPDLRLTITSAGAVFDYDVKTDGPLKPSQEPELSPEPAGPALDDLPAAAPPSLD
jgi:hypothetical protein